LGFPSTETYIQSGNIIFGFDGTESFQDISLRIEKAIFERFNYIIPVMIRTVQEIKEIVSSNPFLKEENFDPAKMAVIFLHDNLTESLIQKVADIDYPPDKFKIIGNEIYTFCPNGFGKTKLYTNFFENKMKVKGTARNWKTISTILDLAGKRL
jgi:uncharacterized protein (DUF1697 family)